MTKMQELLGKILRNRIESELVKEKVEQNFATIKETMDIFLAGDKIAADQYEEFTNLIKPSDNTTDNSETKIS
jgi:hypothetical protein